MGLFDGGNTEKYQKQYTASVQEKLPGEEVLAAGSFYRSGSYGSIALEQFSGLAATASRMLGKKRAGGLSQNVLIAITPEQVYVYGYSPKGTKIKVKDQEAAWGRAGLDASVENTTVTQRITINVPGEEKPIVLDTAKGSGKGFNQPVMELLGATQPS